VSVERMGGYDHPLGECHPPVRKGRGHMSDRMQYGLGAAISLIMVLMYLGFTAPERNDPSLEGASPMAAGAEQALTAPDNQPLPSPSDLTMSDELRAQLDESIALRDRHPVAETQTAASKRDPNQEVSISVKPASTLRTVGEHDAPLTPAGSETPP